MKRGKNKKEPLLRCRSSKSGFSLRELEDEDTPNIFYLISKEEREKKQASNSSQ